MGANAIGAFICQHHFDAAAALRHIARERITSLYLVPTLYHDLVGHPNFAACDPSSVTKPGFAGAAMPDGLLKRVDAAFRPALLSPQRRRCLPSSHKSPATETGCSGAAGASHGRVLAIEAMTAEPMLCRDRCQPAIEGG